VVLGPTASGKSDLALRIAQEIGGEIVNFDSVQVYKGFDIGSAKTPVQERGGVPHHLIDVLDADEVFSAGDFARRARPLLSDLKARGCTPVLAGGTGFYLRALLTGLFDGPGRDRLLRTRLEQTASQRPAGYLHRLLNKLDPQSAAAIHPNDQPKLVRALEVCLLEGAPRSSVLDRGLEPLEGFRILRLGLDPPRDRLYARINERASRMFEGGLVEEVRALLASGVARDAWPLQALGYRQAVAVIDGELDLEEAVEETALKTRRYAKRQLTWFRRQEPETHWVEDFGDTDAAFARWRALQ